MLPNECIVHRALLTIEHICKDIMQVDHELPLERIVEAVFSELDVVLLEGVDEAVEEPSVDVEYNPSIAVVSVHSMC